MINIFWKYINSNGHDKVNSHELCTGIKQEYLPLLIKRIFRWETDQYSIFKGEHGKPLLSGAPSAGYFNISHSKEIWSCSLSENNIGIDIEFVNPHRSIIVNRMFSREEEEELDRISDDAEKMEKFYTLWTAKEAYSKLTGSGLSKDLLKNYTVHCGNCILNRNTGETEAYILTGRLEKDYILTICSEKKIGPEDISIEQL